MRIEIRSCAAVSILLVSLLCSCGKKEESPPAATPAPQGAAPTAQPAAPQTKEQPAPTKAQESAVAALEMNLSGTIGGQPVLMELSIKEGGATVQGSYYLESQGSSSKLAVSGTLQDGVLVMEQSAQGTVIGSFDLTNDPANKSLYLGSWKGQGRVLPVKLTAAK